MSEVTQSIPEPTIQEKHALGIQITLEEKIHYLFEVAMKLEKESEKLAPMLGTFASGPMGGILGGLLR